jgi:hypothetical protein
MQQSGLTGQRASRVLLLCAGGGGQGRDGPGHGDAERETVDGFVEAEMVQDEQRTHGGRQAERPGVTHRYTRRCLKILISLRMRKYTAVTASQGPRVRRIATRR